MKKLFLLIFYIAASNLIAQQYKISGIVIDKSTGLGLGFANIRVEGTTTGTAANIQGEYSLLLPKGNYNLIASFIGYKSDTIEVNLNKNEKVNFFVTPAEILFQEITVLSSFDPAFEAVKKAVEKKEIRKKKIESYSFEAYTKGVIRTNNDMKVNGRDLSISSKKKDSNEFTIAGIFENHSKGFYDDGNYKELIIAQKQSANFSSTINTLTGGRIVQSFYDDNINFFDKEIPSPVSKGGLKFYKFTLSNLLAIDNKTVLEIHFTPQDENDPGFTGVVYISDIDFNFLKIETQLNAAANPGGIFERINIFQQFSEFGNEIYMPIDYRLFFHVNYLGLVRVNFELNSVLYDYEINTKIDEDIFDNAVLTVLPGADKKDSIYWANSITIPNSREEILAYEKIDSLASLPPDYWQNVKSSLLSDRVTINENFSTTGPLGLYHFNRVEGSTINFGIYVDDLIDKRLNTGGKVSYGFADEKFKFDYNFEYLLGNYRTTSIKFQAYDKLKTLFESGDQYNKFTASALALLNKYEFRDYYYTKGASFEIRGDVLHYLRLGFGAGTVKDETAFKNTDFSFFRKDEKYKENLPINNGIINTVGFSFKLDFRKYIEDGYFRRRTDRGKSYIVFEGAVNTSKKDILKSDYDFTSYDLITRGAIFTGSWGRSSFFLEGFLSDGATPLQLMFPQSGNINLVVKENTLRTVKIGEYFGDRGIKLYLKHNFGDKIFRELGIPVLEELQLQLSGYLNGAYSNISKESAAILPIQEYKVLKLPLYEAGFQIGHILFPFSFDFGWRLTHREERRFSFGITVPVL